MIMVIVITLRATIAPFAPESYRDRMLIFRYAGFHLTSSLKFEWFYNWFIIRKLQLCVT